MLITLSSYLDKLLHLWVTKNHLSDEIRIWHHALQRDKNLRQSNEFRLTGYRLLDMKCKEFWRSLSLQQKSTPTQLKKLLQYQTPTVASLSLLNYMYYIHNLYFNMIKKTRQLKLQIYMLNYTIDHKFLWFIGC